MTTITNRRRDDLTFKQLKTVFLVFSSFCLFVCFLSRENLSKYWQIFNLYHHDDDDDDNAKT